MNSSTNTKVNDIIHSLSSAGQMFHSYQQLLENPQLHLAPKKLGEICSKCAKKCLEARQLLLEGIENDTD
jgi:hypothetical protein